MILCATDHKCYLVNGKVYLTNKIYPILKRYASVFGNITLYSRFIETDIPPDDSICDSFISDYVKVNRLIDVLIKKDNNLISAIGKSSLVIGRIPSLPAYKALDCARKQGVPVFTEAMGCAWDVYWNHGFIGKLIAPYMFLKMKSLVKKADYASYVTSEFLQKRYPCEKKSLSASNVLIENTDDSVLSKRIEHYRNRVPKTLKLMTMASIDVRYKGQEYVIRAIPLLLKRGIDVTYYIVGDGCPDYLKSIVQHCHVENNVVFTGKKNRRDILELLDYTDIYVQPSLTEGLPRAVIEAMSRGCIVIGTEIGGIPELLDSSYLVKRKNYSSIACLLLQIDSYSVEKCTDIASRNFEKSKEFYEDVLNEKRQSYFNEVKHELISLNSIDNYNN